jgi:hypothetical protein
MNFFLGEYDVGASSTSTHGRTTQRLRTNSEYQTLVGTAIILKLIENKRGKIMCMETK